MSGLISRFHLHLWQSLHPPHLHQAYLSKAALSSCFMLPADTASSSCPKLNASSLPSVLPFNANPSHPTLCLLCRWPVQTCTWPHPLFPHTKLSLASCLSVPGCAGLVWSQWLCPHCAPAWNAPLPLPLSIPIHPSRPSSDLASTPDLFFYLCIFAFVSSI